MELNDNNLGYTDVSQFSNVVQIVPYAFCRVYIYTDTGYVLNFDCSDIIANGKFDNVRNFEDFKKICFIANDTFALDTDGTKSEWTCHDIAIEYIFKNSVDLDKCPLEEQNDII